MSKKISAYTELATQPATGDFFLLELASNGQYRKIKYSNLLAAGSVTASKVATSAITNTKIASGAVTYDKIDFGGSGHGVWWEEVARTTLGVAADTVSVTGIPARKYLKIVLVLLPTAGTINSIIRFNNDSGSNYSAHFNNSGVNDTTATSATGAWADTGAAAQLILAEYEVVNIATWEKLLNGHYMAAGPAGAANAPVRGEATFKWANTTDQITRVDAINTSGTGDYAIGSEIVILGHN